MSMSDSEAAQRFLDRIGGPALKFPTIGVGYIGQVIAVGTAPQTNIDTGEVLTWADGNPREQLVVTLATGLRDSGDEDDDGERRWFAKGVAATALKRALRAARADLAEGIWLAVVYTSQDAPVRKGMDGQKHYDVRVWSAGSEPGPDDVVGGQKVADLLQQPF